LGRLVRHVIQSRQFAMADFAPYAPSNNEPAAFVAQPVIHDGAVEAVVALQLSIEAINSIMQEPEGMGKTGETYLIGADKWWAAPEKIRATRSGPVPRGRPESSERPCTGKGNRPADRPQMSIRVRHPAGTLKR
jgi:hypothetical protein